MTPQAVAKKAKLEAILERVRTNRARLGHPGAAAAMPAESPADDVIEPVTAPLRLGIRPALVAVPAAPPPPPPVADEPEAPLTWEGEDEEEMIFEEAPEGVGVEDEMELVDEAPPDGVVDIAEFELDAPAAAREEAPPPPALPSATVTPSVAATPAAVPAPPPRPAAAPAPAPPPAAAAPLPPAAVEVRVARVEAPPPDGPVVGVIGEAPAEVARTIGGLLGASLRLFGTG